MLFFIVIIVLNIILRFITVYSIIEFPSYTLLEKKLDELDAFTKLEHPTYADRQWGIASLSLYAQFKTRFMAKHLHHIGKNAVTICELGFNAGHSALIFLEGSPKTTKVYSFDLGDTLWSKRNSEYITKEYGDRFTYIKGDSVTTLGHPTYSKLSCDILLIDGSKDGYHRRQDILLFRNISHPGSFLFLDEVNNFPCVSGAISFDHTGCSRGPYAACSKEYNKLVREKIMKVHDCTETPTLDDGFCLAEFL